MIVPVYPAYISLNDWAGRLVADDIHDNLPHLASEKEWKEWGNEVISSSYFTKLDIPSPFDMGENVKWEDWATKVYYALLNQKTQKIKK